MLVGAGVQAILSLASTCMRGEEGLWAFQNCSPGPGLFSQNEPKPGQNEPKPGLQPQHQINQSWGRGGRGIMNPRSSSAM